MSFFKGIGKMIKRNVNFKTLVKVGTKAAGMIPGVGGQVQSVMQGFSDAAELKKQQRQAEAQAVAEQASQTAGNLIGSQTGKLVNKAIAGASDSFKETTGQAGASVVDFTIKEWFKKHVWHVVAGVGVILGLIFVPKLFRKKRFSAPRYGRR